MTQDKKLIGGTWPIERLQLIVNVILAVIGIIAICIYVGQLRVYQSQLNEMIKATKAAQKSADTAAESLVLQQRPWVKIKHRILRPLTFGTEAWKGPVASAVIGDILENVGQSVALNVLSWEDIIPMDSDGSIRTARLRQSEMCDAYRHRTPRSLTGYMLFPKDNPWVQNSTVGPKMETVLKATASSPISGKVGFVLVGCVSYRSAFEPKDSSMHQTGFTYYLGNVGKDGSVNPYVVPSGTASELQLIASPEGFSAD